MSRSWLTFPTEDAQKLRSNSFLETFPEETQQPPAPASFKPEDAVMVSIPETTEALAETCKDEIGEGGVPQATPLAAAKPKPTEASASKLDPEKAKADIAAALQTLSPEYLMWLTATVGKAQQGAAGPEATLLRRPDTIDFEKVSIALNSSKDLASSSKALPMEQQELQQGPVQVAPLQAEPPDSLPQPKQQSPTQPLQSEQTVGFPQPDPMHQQSATQPLQSQQTVGLSQPDPMQQQSTTQPLQSQQTVGLSQPDPKQQQSTRQPLQSQQTVGLQPDQQQVPAQALQPQPTAGTNPTEAPLTLQAISNVPLTSLPPPSYPQVDPAVAEDCRIKGNYLIYIIPD